MLDRQKQQLPQSLLSGTYQTLSSQCLCPLLLPTLCPQLHEAQRWTNCSSPQGGCGQPVEALPSWSLDRTPYSVDTCSPPTCLITFTFWISHPPLFIFPSLELFHQKCFKLLRFPFCPSCAWHVPRSLKTKALGSPPPPEPRLRPQPGHMRVQEPFLVGR